ncbi:MAG: hypothetical protein QW270_05405 [Candidatus Bathyarchaeia archaeon]
MGCVYYLTSVCYEQSIQLCWDSPVYYRYDVWATPDNLIAYHSLVHYNFTVADSIRKKLAEIAENYSLWVDWVGLPRTLKHEVLWGIPLPFNNTFYNSTWITLYEQNEYTIKIDIANHTLISDWEAYADLCIYNALDLYLKGNITQAKERLQKVIDMWDGYGLKDQEYFNGGKYETYKLCLLYYANGKINNKPLPFEKQLIERIWKQQAPNGGIHTHYNRKGDYCYRKSTTMYENPRVFIHHRNNFCGNTYTIMSS